MKPPKPSEPVVLMDSTVSPLKWWLHFIFLGIPGLILSPLFWLGGWVCVHIVPTRTNAAGIGAILYTELNRQLVATATAFVEAENNPDGEFVWFEVPGFLWYRARVILKSPTSKMVFIF